MNEPFDTIEEALADIAAGKLVIVTDDENRENEGDLVMAASKATPETVNMMIRHARGLICVPTVEHQLRRLGISQMVPENRESQRTAFAVSVDAAEGISTGISAYDRAKTIAILADPQAKPEALVQPGHIFPLLARPGGVLQRAGHTEAAVDLASLAGLHPSGVICEILNEDGSMARLPELVELKKKFGLHMISIAQLIEFRHRRERLVELVAESPFRSAWGEFKLSVYRSLPDGRQHLVFTLGQPDESRVRKACNRSRQVQVITFAGHGADIWWSKQAKGLERFDNLSVLDLDSTFVERWAEQIQRAMRWNVLIQDGEVQLINDQMQLDVIPTWRKRIKE